MTIFVDTNIFIRYLTKDDPVKAQACFDLFQRADRGELTLTTTEAVITEIVYVLSSKRTYNLGRAEIRARLYPLLSVAGLHLPDQPIFLRALDLYVTYPVDFEDGLIAAQMEQQQITQVYSYDQSFDRIPSIERLEP